MKQYFTYYEIKTKTGASLLHDSFIYSSEPYSVNIIDIEDVKKEIKKIVKWETDKTVETCQIVIKRFNLI